LITSEELANALQNMVANTLGDRVICDQSAIRLMVLEEELKFLRKQLQEVSNESV
jgi:RNA-binding protein YlmH